MSTPGARSFVRAARAELDPVLAAWGIAYEYSIEDGRGVDLVFAGSATEVAVRWDADADDVTVWLGSPDEDLPTLDERLRALGEDAAADRLRRVAAPGCETGVRVAEHARVLRQHGDALFGR